MGHRSRIQRPAGTSGATGSSCTPRRGRTALVPGPPPSGWFGEHDPAEVTTWQSEHGRATGDSDVRRARTRGAGGRHRSDPRAGRGAGHACPSTRGRPASAGCCTGSTRTSSRTWPGRSRGSSRRSMTALVRRGRRDLFGSIIDRSRRKPSDSVRIRPAGRHPVARRRDAGGRPVRPRGADARQHRARGTFPAAVARTRGGPMGHRSGATDARPEETWDPRPRRTPGDRGRRPGRALGLPCPSGSARWSRPGVPAGGASAGADAAALRSRGRRLLGDQGRARLSGGR